MTRYSFVIIWFLIVAVIRGMTKDGATELVPYDGSYRREVKWWFAILVLIPVILIVTFRPNSNMGDTGFYRQFFLSSEGSIDEIKRTITTDIGKDKGYTVLQSVIKIIIGSNDVLYFFIIAAFQAFALAKLFKEHSDDYVFSIFLFVVSAEYLQWMCNGMRQFIAVCITLFAFLYILKKKYIRAIIIVLIASTVHGTAVLLIPVMFIVNGEAWNRKTILYIIAILLAVAMIDRFTNIFNFLLQNTQYSGTMSEGLWNEATGTNIFRVAVYSVPAVYSFIYRKQIQEEGTLAINVAANMSIITAGLYLLSSVMNGVYMGRLPIYCSLYSYILLPWLIQRNQSLEQQQFLKIVIVILYLVFYYIQTVIHWNMSLFA